MHKETQQSDGVTMVINRPLSVLILEDGSTDFALTAAELKHSGFAAEFRRAETEAEYLSELDRRPDIILANDPQAGFAAPRALELLQKSGVLIPFIVLTDAIGEESMLACMRLGASDYLLRGRGRKLGPAVSRALEENGLRRDKQAADRALHERNIELEEQNRQVQAASRMKSVFLATMSHELRTPLTAIIGFTELLVDGKVGAVSIEQLDLLQDLLGNALHLLGLINDVLDLAKVESGTMLFHPERASIADLVGEAVAGLRLIATGKQIALISDVRVPATEVLLDRQRLKQILYNYISNALKFTPVGGMITVRVAPAGSSSFRLEVEDTGIGIAQADLAGLFQDFHQLKDGFSKHAPGTGLGLALTKRLVEAQGGSVGVTSEPGLGSTFYAVVPYEPGCRAVSPDCEPAVVPACL